MYVDSRARPARSREYNVRRREQRYVASIPVTLQHFLRHGPLVSRGLSLDVSLRGMAALVCGAPRVGETVIIAMSLPKVAIELLATVRHSSEAHSGFEFFPLSRSAERAIKDWIQELREHEEKLFPYPYLATANSR